MYCSLQNIFEWSRDENLICGFKNNSWEAIRGCDGDRSGAILVYKNIDEA